MVYFKRCFVALFTLIILCFCCSCGVNNKVAGMYKWDDGWDSYVIVNKDGTFKVYDKYLGSDPIYYNFTMSGKYEIKGDKVKISLNNILNTDLSEEFIFKRHDQNIVLYGQLSGDTLTLEPVDSKGFTFSEGLDEMYPPTNSTNGTNANSVNEDTQVTPLINNADDTDGDYLSPLTSNFNLEMGTDYPVYKSGIPIPEAYVDVDDFTQDIANSIELSYEDFLLARVLNNEDTRWMDICEYNWYITAHSKGVYSINVSLNMPDVGYDISSVLTFNEYGYYEVSNFILECTG